MSERTHGPKIWNSFTLPADPELNADACLVLNAAAGLSAQLGRVFRPFLKRIAGSSCRWVTSPDVVGDARATMDLWATWRPLIRRHGLEPALVAQDGLTSRDVPWSEVGGIFIGGSTRYKLSETAVEIVAEGNRRGIWTHMGRVNTARRVLFAAAIGCRSVDGSSFSRFSKTHLPWALRLAGQRPLQFAETLA